MAKVNTTSTTAFRSQNIEGAASASSGNTETAAKAGIPKTDKNPVTDKKPKTAEKTVKGKAEPTEDKKAEPKTEVIPAKDTSVVVATKESIALHLKSLDDAVKSHEKTFFSIGLDLYWFYKTQAFIEINGTSYENIADFAKRRYGISKATTYQYIGIYDKFGDFDAGGNCIGINPKYKDYGSTQLIVMSQMTDEVLAKCTPNQKIYELKALLKGIPDNDEDENGGGDNSGDDSDEKNGRKPFNNVRTANTQELYSFSSVDELEKAHSKVFETMKKTLSQSINGVKYGVSVVITW